MKTPLKVGDLVAVYDGVVKYRRTIELIAPSGVVRVYGDSKWFHPKQCRRLVKKKRREWWVNIYEKQHLFYWSREDADSDARDRIECVHVREVKA